jgi:hypothetical protein
MRTHDPQKIRVIANKLDEHLPLDGWWFNDNRSTNAYQDAGVIVAFNTPRTNLGVIQDEYRTLFGILDGFNEYYQNLVKAEIIQLIGRPRAHLNPEKQFTIYLVSTDFDASFVSEFGVNVVSVEAFELCPEAGTQIEQTRFRILEAVRQLTNSGVAIASITQQAVAQISGLIIQPTLALWLLSPWLDLFPNPSLLLGFHELIHAMNQFQPFFPDG